MKLVNRIHKPVNACIGWDSGILSGHLRAWFSWDAPPRYSADGIMSSLAWCSSLQQRRDTSSHGPWMSMTCGRQSIRISIWISSSSTRMKPLRSSSMNICVARRSSIMCRFPLLYAIRSSQDSGSTPCLHPDSRGNQLWTYDYVWSPRFPKTLHWKWLVVF